MDDKELLKEISEKVSKTYTLVWWIWFFVIFTQILSVITNILIGR